MLLYPSLLPSSPSADPSLSFNASPSPLPSCLTLHSFFLSPSTQTQSIIGDGEPLKWTTVCTYGMRADADYSGDISPDELMVVLRTYGRDLARKIEGRSYALLLFKILLLLGWMVIGAVIYRNSSFCPSIPDFGSPNTIHS